jgi:hypothetical protein
LFLGKESQDGSQRERRKDQIQGESSNSIRSLESLQSDGIEEEEKNEEDEESVTIIHQTKDSSPYECNILFHFMLA